MIKSYGVIGVGMVGGALARYFEKVKNVKPFLYDKGKNLGSPQEVNQAEVIFVCVPTPFDKEKNYFDLSCIEDAFQTIQGEKIVVIKSTVLPGTTELFQKKYPQHKILMNPEFLTEMTADQDMCYPDRQIVGYTQKSYNVAGDVLQILPLAPFERILPATEVEAVKYFGNTWFSTKVIFANQFYDLCQSLGIDYNRVMEAASADKRIGRTHLEVWHKGYRGFGGKCLVGNERIFQITSEGLKIVKIKDFQGGEILSQRDGKIIVDRVRAKSERKISETIKVYLSKVRTLEMSPDHIVVTVNENGDFVEKEAKDLTQKDKIPIIFGEMPVVQQNIFLNFFENFGAKEEVFVEEIDKKYVGVLKPYLTFNQYKGFRRNRPISLPLNAILKTQIPLGDLKIKTGKTGSWVPNSLQLDEDFARLIGYYLSEGCTSDQRVFFSFGYHEKELIDDLISILKKLNIRFSSQIGYWESHKSSYSIKVSSRILFEYFSKYCGHNCYSKRIPEYLFFTPQSIKDNLLKGLFSGDGSNGKSNMGNYHTISFASVSKDLIEGVDLLLREKGILASKGKIITSKSKVPSFVLLISETQSLEKIFHILPKKWQEKIQISSKIIKSPAYQRISEYLAVLNIRQIEKIKKPNLVYALETQSGYYLTSGGILTHNCLPKDMKAFIKFAEKKGVDLKLHKVVDEINDKLLREQGITDPERYSKRDG